MRAKVLLLAVHCNFYFDCQVIPCSLNTQYNEKICTQKLTNTLSV